MLKKLPLYMKCAIKIKVPCFVRHLISANILKNVKSLPKCVKLSEKNCIS